jgi:hypothetical protein
MFLAKGATVNDADDKAKKKTSVNPALLATSVMFSADICKFFCQGFTALHICAYANAVPPCKLLLENVRFCTQFRV